VKGVYLLLIQLDRDVDVVVGALGFRHFVKGFYIYVGSAQNNLEKRVSRHFRRKKRLFWHIDYLLDSPSSVIRRVFFKEAARSEECNIASELSQQNEAVVGFGCSDCRCRSHFFRIESSNFRLFMKELRVHGLNL
jgi:Uri superfamily endonuclease